MNRWLIRMFTGHGSGAVRAFAQSMGAAPLAAASALRTAFEADAGELLGDAASLLSLADRLPLPKLPTFSLSVAGEREPDFAHRFASGIPLRAIDAQNLVDARLVDEIRGRIVSGKDLPPVHATSLLSRMAIDGVARWSVAAAQVIAPDKLRQVGVVRGGQWTREHYRHDLWQPMMPPTAILSARCTPRRSTAIPSIADEAAAWLKCVEGFDGWPADTQATMQRFEEACEAWRRLHLPPVMCAAADPRRETPCLSPRALYRLSLGGETPAVAELINLPKTPGAAIRDNGSRHGLDRLTERINHWNSSDERLGGRQKRAGELCAEVEAMPSCGSAVFAFCRDLIALECSAFVRNAPWANKPSSFATRWTAIEPVLSALPLNADPYEFEEGEWTAFVRDVDQYCLNASAAAGNVKSAGPAAGADAVSSARARDALQRMFRVLGISGWTISPAVWQAIGNDVVTMPRVSACSTLVFEVDETRMRMLAGDALQDWPLEAAHFGARLIGALAVPTRTAEWSAVAHPCVTKDDAIAIPNGPFAADKSDNAPRAVRAAASRAQALRAYEREVMAMCPNAGHLFRFDDAALERDVEITALLGKLLRVSTGDSEARVQSLRATVYCEILWPGCREFLHRFLAEAVSADMCRQWLERDDLSLRWSRPLEAAAAAGHGSVNPGIDSYAGLWPIVLAVHMRASLHGLPPGPEFIASAGAKANSLAAAKSRGRAIASDPWVWLLQQVRLPDVAPLYMPPDRGSEEAPNAHPAASSTAAQLDEAGSPDACRYIVNRLLGKSKSAALHAAKITDGLARTIEPRLPSHKEVNALRARTKGDIDGAALDADLSIATVDPEYRPLRDWLFRLPVETVRTVVAVLSRDKRAFGSVAALRTPTFWRELVGTMPANLSLGVRFGRARHLSSEERASLRRIGAALQIRKRDPRIGVMPRVVVARRTGTNKVVEARQTAAVRLICAARDLMASVIRDLEWLQARERAANSALPSTSQGETNA